MTPDDRKHRVLVTFELPSFYAEDMTREALAEWMDHTDQSYEDACLEEMRMGNSVLIVLESHGEKDGEVIVVPGLLRAVIVEDQPPSDEPDKDEQFRLASQGAGQMEWLAEHLDDVLDGDR